MLRSLFSGITGLRQHQTMMDVVGNNIANVNTTGFKSSSVVFEDTLSQMVRAAGAPTPGAGGLGGVNPAQIGLGVQLGGIATNFGQGSAQNTGKQTDLMIQGDGFFVVRNVNESIFSRAGSFTFDSDGRLVNNSGMVVQGWSQLNADGSVNTDSPLSDITLPTSTMLDPTPTSNVTIGGNITANADPTKFATNTLTLGATVYDGAGNATPVSMVFQQTDGATYTISVKDASGAEIATGDITFDPATGKRVSSTDPTFTANGQSVNLDLSSVTDFGGPKSLAVTATDGSTAGNLQQFRIGPDGSVIGVFSNGLKKTMAKVALANFNNPGGLEKIGDTCFRTTTNSGLAQVGVAGSGGRGELVGGALEMSNVDLAQEFTSLIVAQRGFQANSRVITSSDEMLQELVNLKR